jgi:hypothetical protein
MARGSPKYDQAPAPNSIDETAAASEGSVAPVARGVVVPDICSSAAVDR